MIISKQWQVYMLVIWTLIRPYKRTWYVHLRRRFYEKIYAWFCKMQKNIEGIKNVKIRNCCNSVTTWRDISRPRRKCLTDQDNGGQRTTYYPCHSWLTIAKHFTPIVLTQPGRQYQAPYWRCMHYLPRSLFLSSSPPLCLFPFLAFSCRLVFTLPHRYLSSILSLKSHAHTRTHTKKDTRAANGRHLLRCCIIRLKIGPSAKISHLSDARFEHALNEW